MKGFVLAIQFLTRLPMPHVTADATDFAHAMRWFPAVGLLIGAILAFAAWVGAWIDGWTGALLALLSWVAVSGALHLDGLSDLADARGAAHRDRARFLAVMADPHVGSFGVVAIVLQLIAKLVLLRGLVDASGYAVLILIPFAARIGPLVWTIWLPPLHAGLGSRFTGAIGVWHIVLWAGIIAIALVAAPALLAAPPAIALWGWWLRRHVGGISGDCHGAGIEFVETALLAIALVVSRL